MALDFDVKNMPNSYDIKALKRWHKYKAIKWQYVIKLDSTNFAK